MSDEQSYGDDGPAYGDDGPAYGDEGPAYGDEGPAYGDEGPAYGDEGPAYGDEGPAYGDGGVAYGDDEAAYGDYGPDGQTYDQEAYAADGTYDEAAYADGATAAGADESVYSEDAGPAGAGGGGRGKRLALMAGAFLLLGSLGAGGYFFVLAPGGDSWGADPMGILRNLPVVGDWLGAPAQTATNGKQPGNGQAPAGGDAPAASSGVSPVRWVMNHLPFVTHDDPPDVTAKLEDNLVMVQKAIVAYYAEHKALPSTSSAITKQLKVMGLATHNPFRPDEPAPIDLADVPAEPGAVAYKLGKGRFELRIGDGRGEPMKLNDVAFVLEGSGEAEKGGSVASKPGARPSGSPGTEKGASAAADAAASGPGGKLALHPIDGKNAGGMDNLGVVPGPKGSQPPPLPTSGTPASVPPVPGVADAGMAPSPGSSLSPRDLIAMRLKRNREFDYWRVKGITLVYSARTEEALDAFKKALELRPNDESVRQWVTTINGVIDRSRNDAKAKFLKERDEAIKNAASRVARPPEPPPAPREAAPPRAAAPRANDGDDASKMLNELKKADKVPLLAPPKLDQ